MRSGLVVGEVDVVDEERLSPAFGERALHWASQMPQEGIGGTLEADAELPARTLAVSHQVNGVEAAVGRHHHSGSFGEGLPAASGSSRQSL